LWLIPFLSSFFENIDRFLQPDYRPSEADILRTRIRSTGIEEAEFTFADMKFKMMDVGGQRSERRKWIHCFENTITAVVFCASLSCYDQVLREDDKTNAMDETLALFDEISTNNFFSGVSMILLLNKLDLFTEKVKTVDPKIWNKNYTGTSICRRPLAILFWILY
jgi:GTPase SAR1 family protein